MAKHSFEKRSDDGFSVGLPVGVMLCCMLGITIYLAVLGVNIPPPSSKVYLASDFDGKP